MAAIPAGKEDLMGLTGTVTDDPTKKVALKIKSAFARGTDGSESVTADVIHQDVDCGEAQLQIKGAGVGLLEVGKTYELVSVGQ